MVIISVKYGIDPNKIGFGYRYLYISWEENGEQKEEIFNSGNFVKDYFLMFKFLYTTNLVEKYTIARSSSLDDFLCDTQKYMPCYLLVRNDKFILLYKKPQNEVFATLYIWEKCKPTYEIFKEIIGEK